MYPTLFTLGPLTFHTYGLMIALGILLGLQLTIFLAMQDGLKKTKAEEAVYQLLFYFVIGGLLGGRIFYAIFFWDDFGGDWLGVFKVWQGGLVSYGGLLGALSGFTLWYRKNKIAPWPKILDWLAPSIAFGHALGRVGCFFAGCCYGRPATVPWAVVFNHPESLAPFGIPLHPTQLYESALLVGVGGILLLRFFQSRAQSPVKAGGVFADYLVLYPVARFGVEFFRADTLPFWGLKLGQWASLGVFAAGCVYRIYLGRIDKQSSF